MPSRHRLPALLVFAVALAATAGAFSACAPARISEPGGNPRGSGGAGGGSGGVGGEGASGPSLIRDRSLCKPGPPDVGSSPLRRLSRVEYNNMVRDLLGDDSRPADQFVAEDKVLAFNSNAITPVGELAAEQYFAAAETIAEGVDLAAQSGCGVPPDDACAEPYLERFARRAFRGTLETADRDRLFALYRSTKTEYDAETALRLAIRSVLVSPRFLYVIEKGEAGSGGVVPLTQHEIASRLALYLWRSVPDDTLIAAADSGALGDGASVAVEARRLLADPRALGALEDFAVQWLDLERIGNLAKSSDHFPDFAVELATDFRTETLTFFREFVAAEATLPKLFTARFSYLNSRLAGFYGVSGGGGDGFVPTDLDPSERSGILTQASVLASQAHPTKPAPVLRGKLVRERIFCQTLPVPPPNVDMNVPDAPAGTTTRDAFREHATNKTCAKCHRLMDPIGFAFSNYDGIGKFVTAENGVSVDVAGEIIDAYEDLDGTFTGVVELSERVAASEHVKQCFAVQNFRYALGRAEVTNDACSLQAAYDDFAAEDFTMTELVIAITASDSFRHVRATSPAGACQ